MKRKTEQTLKQALYAVAKANARLCEEDVALLEQTGHSKHFMFPYAQWNEADTRMARIASGQVKDRYERVSIVSPDAQHAARYDADIAAQQHAENI